MGNASRSFRTPSPGAAPPDAMCIVCRSPQRLAVEADIRAGKSLRAIQADFPTLNRNSLSRHHRMHMTGAPVAAPSPSPAPQNTPAAPVVRHRTRPHIDDESRLRSVMLLRAEGRTHAEIAGRLGLHPATVREFISRANAHALERVRAQTVEELVAQHMIERQARARNLSHLQEQAEARGDIRIQLDIERLKLAEAREHREWLGALGGFDHFRIKTHDERQESDGRSPDCLISMAKQLFGALAADDPVAALAALDDDAPAIVPGPAGTTHLA